MNNIRERLDQILEAQRLAPLDEWMPPSPFIVTRFFLNTKDLKDIRPHLTQKANQPDLGDEGRYRSVTVFPLHSYHWTQLPFAHYRGIRFEYVPALIVD